MKVEIIGSSKLGNRLKKEEAMKFSGLSAGICYLPDTLETLFNEPEEKTMKRVENTLKNGHHSVFDHVTYNLVLHNIPKIFAMILNNEKMYTTSEKSGRYTKMEASEEEKVIYEKWIEILKKEILKEYPKITDRRLRTLSQENARCFISMFTPATTMEYTVSLRQLNYIVHFFENYIKDEDDNDFNKKLKPVMKQFNEQVKDLVIPDLNADTKGRIISLFDKRNHKEEFGESYSVNYYESIPGIAQALRHRTINYSIKIEENPKYYVPDIIKENEKLKQEWLKDMNSLKDYFPQGMLVKVNERGTVENFILKCKERLCGCAQLEIALQTKNTLEKYLEKTKNTNEEIYELLKPYSTGARCTFKGFKCTSPCEWGAKGAFTRKV